MKTFTAWIALSAAGYPAPFIGMAFTRRTLKHEYAKRFGGAFDENGYVAVKVQVSRTAKGSHDE